MLTLDLPPSVEAQIIENAHAQDLSVSQYIQNLLPPKKDVVSLKAAAGLMKGRIIDGSQYQDKIRSEWDNVPD